MPSQVNINVRMELVSSGPEAVTVFIIRGLCGACGCHTLHLYPQNTLSAVSVLTVRTRVSVRRMVSSGMLRRRTLRSVHRLLVAASVVPSSPILVTLMKEALGPSEDTILHSHRSENLKSYKECVKLHSERRPHHTQTTGRTKGSHIISHHRPCYLLLVCPCVLREDTNQSPAPPCSHGCTHWRS
jgi:hypothetical protein